MSRPRMPSPSTTQIDSTTTSAGTSGTWPALGMLAGRWRASPVTSESITSAGSSPEAQVCRGLVPARQASTSAI